VKSHLSLTKNICGLLWISLAMLQRLETAPDCDKWADRMRSGNQFAEDRIGLGFCIFFSCRLCNVQQFLKVAATMTMRSCIQIFFSPPWLRFKFMTWICINVLLRGVAATVASLGWCRLTCVPRSQEEGRVLAGIKAIKRPSTNNYMTTSLMPH